MASLFCIRLLAIWVPLLDDPYYRVVAPEGAWYIVICCPVILVEGLPLWGDELVAIFEVTRAVGRQIEGGFELTALHALQLDRLPLGELADQHHLLRTCGGFLLYGEGVERVFQTHSPLIHSVELKRRGDVRRAKLYYLRNLSGKAARIKEKLN